ncbi:MAG TPA: hypothetical protein VIX19_02985 [Terriglobales bacterium]
MNVFAHNFRRNSSPRKNSRRLLVTCWLVLLILLAAAPAAHAAGGSDDEYDSYKLRFDGFWFYSHPAGHFTSAGNTGLLDLQEDIDFNSYSTFVGKVDWKFTHKNHLYFIATNFDQSKTIILDRAIIFQGETFNVGATATGRLQSMLLIPGYQYDFIRRKRGSLGVQVQANIIDVTGSLNAAAQVNNGVSQGAAFASGNLRVPLPVAGPTMRYYIFNNSGRLFVDANVLGMYFFGYGNYVSSMGTVGVTITKNVSVRGGYQLGSRFDINTKAQRLGVTLSQKGALVGLEISF